jgi:hypothetical protein
MIWRLKRYDVLWHDNQACPNEQPLLFNNLSTQMALAQETSYDFCFLHTRAHYDSLC